MASILKTRLIMTFLDEDDKRVSLTVDEPADHVDEASIKSVMDTVVAKDIFLKDGLRLVKTVEAKIVATDTTEFDLI